MVAILIFSLHCSFSPAAVRYLARLPLAGPSLDSFNSWCERRGSLIQLTSLQKIVVAFTDHLLLGIFGNEQSAWVQLRTPLFHQA